MRSRNRRTLLGLLSSGAVTAITGCLDGTDGDADPGSTVPPTDGEPTTSPETTTASTTESTDDETTESDDEAAEPTATVDAFDPRAWLPAPDAYGTEAYWTYYVDATAAANADLTRNARDRLSRLFYPIPGSILPFGEAAESLAATGDAGVATLAVDVERVVSRLNDIVDDGEMTRSSASRSPDGYVEYVSEPSRVWVGSDHVLFGTDATKLNAMLDAHAGDVDRYEETTDFGPVLDAVGDGDVLGGRAGSQQVVEDSTAFAYHWSFEPDAAVFTSAFAFPDTESVNDQQLSALTEEDGFAEYGEFERSTTGAVGLLEASIAIEEFDLLERENDGGGGGGGSSDPVPQIAFEFEFERGGDDEWDGDDDERVVITHTGGDIVDVDRMSIQYDGTNVAESGNVASTPPPAADWQAGGEWTLSPASTDFAFESGEDVAVVWTSSDESQSAVLATATLP